MPGAIAAKPGYWLRADKDLHEAIPLSAIPTGKDEKGMNKRLDYCRNATEKGSFFYNSKLSDDMFTCTHTVVKRPEAQGGDIPIIVHVPVACPNVDPDSVILCCGSGIFNSQRDDRIMNFVAGMFNKTRFLPTFITVGLRQAPTHKWPAPLEDVSCVYDALKSDEIKALIGEPSKIGLMAYSFHAVTCCHLAIKLVEEKKPLNWLALHFPWADPRMEGETFKSEGKWRNMSPGYVKWVWSVSMTEGIFGKTELTEEQIKAVSVMELPWEKLAGIPALVVHATRDCVRDDATSLAKLMQEKGLDVSQIESDGLHAKAMDTHIVSQLEAFKWYFARFGRDSLPKAKM